MEEHRILNEGSMVGKTAIITGANRGIGLETALELAKMGARVVLGCRDMDKAVIAKKKIEETTHNGNVVIKKLDLGSFQSIESFAKDICENEDRIDILINNAGVLANSYRTTEDGFELHFGINYLGHFLLTKLLLDLLKKSAPSRIVHVSSIGHRYGRIHWEDLNMENCFNGVYAYNQSKLMNVLFSLELSKRLAGTGVTSNSLHPGAINTDIFRESDGCCKLGGCIGFGISLVAMLRRFMSPPSKGAETVVYCATNHGIESISGHYFRNCRVKREASRAQDETAAKKLWELSEHLTNLPRKTPTSNE